MNTIDGLPARAHLHSDLKCSTTFKIGISHLEVNEETKNDNQAALLETRPIDHL